MFRFNFRFKSCPRCEGDLIVNWGYYEWHEQCLQCGYQRDLKGIAKVQATTSSGRRKGIANNASKRALKRR